MIQRRRSFKLLACFLSALPGFCAKAQDPRWVQAHTKKNPGRVEGLLDQPNGMSDYEVLGFFAEDLTAAQHTPTEQASNLRIRYYLATGLHMECGKGPASIEVRQLGGRTNYLMRASEETGGTPAVSGWNSFVWPTNDVISKSHINPSNLGVVVKLGVDTGGDPLQLAPAVYDDATGGESKIGSYRLVLRIKTMTLKSLSYSIQEGAKTVANCHYSILDPCAKTAPSARKDIEAGSLLVLPVDLFNAPAGCVTVRLLGQYKNSEEKLDRSYEFYHQPDEQ